MDIGILGCGNLGRCLGQLWEAAGHTVWRASSDPAKGQPYPEVVADSKVLLYTLRGVDPRTLAPAEAWRGKLLLDCNLPEIPLQFDFAPIEKSMALQLADQVPMCQVVKAFCLHPVELYYHGPQRLREWGVQSFFCGDLAESKLVVEELARDLGLLPFDCGPLKRAHLLESQGNFWRLFQLNQGQSLVSQFQLVGYPEPPEVNRQASYLSADTP